VPHIDAMSTASVNPPATLFHPETAILSLGPDFYDAVEPARFPKHILRFRNDRAAAELGLAEMNDEAWISHFGRFEPMPGSLPQPLALRYHGHQFRSYNPDIGDGRGFLFAQARDIHGRLMDFGTKGSGQTPYSRFGDGRLTLKGAVREVLATEMLEALGVRTSRSFSVIETGEALQRNDEPSPTRSAVLVRYSHGHIRYGTFQRLAYLGEAENIAKLTDYALFRLLGDTPGGGDAGQRLLDHAVKGAAALVASYMAAGFVHGVLNTDNISITAESFDYGPWRFNPSWNTAFTAAYFDQGGLYAFGRQPETLFWNLLQLARCLALIAPPEELEPILNAFPAAYEAELRTAMLRRLGVKPRDAQSDLALLKALETALAETQIGIDRFFFDWFGGRRHGPSPEDQGYDRPVFADFVAAISTYAPASGMASDYFHDSAPCSMLIDEVEAIWAAIAEDDDWQAFYDKIAAVRRMGEALAD
jgi:uncharacterized protein YdiU (UPF0061 family)